MSDDEAGRFLELMELVHALADRWQDYLDSIPAHDGNWDFEAFIGQRQFYDWEWFAERAYHLRDYINQLARDKANE